MAEVNYSDCIKILYPNITDCEFSLEEDETCIKLIWNREDTKPTFQELETVWINVVKQTKIKEMYDVMNDEMENGTSGYLIQGLNTNFRIDSGRSDLDNMKNLRDYCRQMIIAFTNGSYPANLGGQITNNHPTNNPNGNWYGVISSFAIESGDWINGSAQGMAYINDCHGTLLPNEPIYMNDLPDRPMVAIPVFLVKDNMAGTNIKSFDNNFYEVTNQELDVIIFELQAYGLWLYQHKWEKVSQILSCETIDEVNQITFWN